MWGSVCQSQEAVEGMTRCPSHSLAAVSGGELFRGGGLGFLFTAGGGVAEGVGG